MIYKTSLLIILLFANLLLINAKEYHVAKTGNDANTGTMQSPFLTIQAAANIAQPGDVIIVHAGVYREHVNPIRGGTSESMRIVYQSAEGEKVEIRGSEVVNNWVRFKGNTWKVTIPNSYFGEYNPFKEIITGDWFFPGDRDHHTGDVFLNDTSLYEKELLEEVLNPARIENKERSDYTWFCESDAHYTYIYANFQMYDPNEEKVEITTRRSCFYPLQTGIDYITVRGFTMTQAATPWAPPTAEQIGIIGTNWSKGWIIENNVVSNSRCVGITLGKDRESGNNVGDPADKGRVPDGVNLYNEVVEKAIQSGWNKDLVGSHIVRNNEIYFCEQAGICGSLGAINSTITNNHIHDIFVKQQFTGFEISGIKIHAAIDMVIKGNHIHNASKGVWLDWMAQGTRVSSNILYDNMHQDLFLEVNHGPVIVDNNLFLSPFSIRNLSVGTALVHNIVKGRVHCAAQDRDIPVFKPHSTIKTGLHATPGGDDRFYNNIFISDGTDKYQDAAFTTYADGNVYMGKAQPYSEEKKFLRIDSFDPEVKIEKENDRLYLLINYDGSQIRQRNKLITTEILGKTIVTNQKFENSDGSTIEIDEDLTGSKRNRKNPTAGAFENVKPGRNRIRIL